MKEIKLTKGMVALVNDEDYEYLNQWKWQFDGGYARRTIYHGTDANGKRIREIVWMHRLITDCPNGFVVDHIDGNVVNNQRSNLRICTMKQNLINQKSPPKFNKRFKGIYPMGNNYSVRIVVEGKRINIGYFSDEIAAANAYNYYARKFHGDYAYLNNVQFMEKEEWIIFRTSRKEIPYEQIC